MIYVLENSKKVKQKFREIIGLEKLLIECSEIQV